MKCCNSNCFLLCALAQAIAIGLSFDAILTSWVSVP
jgi:hypothetical protein